MSQSDREKWDARYAGQAATDVFAASEWLKVALERMARERATLHGLRALDLACGGGRNSLELLAAGFTVDAVDVSAEGLAIGRQRTRQDDRLEDAADGIRWIQADLDDGLPVSGPYDLLVMIRYLDLALLRQAVRLLSPGGVLVVELHMEAGSESVAGPRNPDFLVRPGALGEAVAELEPWLQTEGIVEGGDGRREALARYMGCVR